MTGTHAAHLWLVDCHPAGPGEALLSSSLEFSEHLPLTGTHAAHLWLETAILQGLVKLC